MTYGKMTSVNMMSHPAFAGSANAGHSCAFSAYISILGAILMASIIICGLIAETAVGILVVLGVLVLLVGLLAVCYQNKLKARTYA